MRQHKPETFTRSMREPLELSVGLGDTDAESTLSIIQIYLRVIKR